MHWATKYIGTPYEGGAQGPDRFDCWSFFRHVQKEEYGRDVPPIAIDVANLRKLATTFKMMVPAFLQQFKWVDTINPKDGDAVLMSNGPDGSHVGVWARVGGREVIVHCEQPVGVVITRLLNTTWRRVRYYTPAVANDE